MRQHDEAGVRIVPDPQPGRRNSRHALLLLNEQMLEEALRLSGERTYSAAVNRALDEFVRRIRAGRILELAGSGLWEGDLADMRSDASASGRRRRSRGSG